jgi:hypothetical protein
MKRFLITGLALLAFAGVAVAAEVNDLETSDANNTARFPENMAPSAVNDGARALEGILARWYKDVNGALVAGGTGTAYTLAANQTISAYYDGLFLVFEPGTTNTGSTTLNVDSVGAKTIYKHYGQTLDAGDLRAGGKYIVTFNADVDGWLLISPTNLIDGSDIRVNTITGGHIAIGSDAQGDILYYDGTDYTRLGAGTQGDLLQTDGSGSNPLWASAVTSGTPVADQATMKAYVDASAIVLGTQQASTSGTSINFTSIPAGTKRITVMFSGVSTNGTSNILVQLGDSGGLETTGYLSSAAGGVTNVDSTAGFILTQGNSSSAVWGGSITFSLQDSGSFSWVGGGTLAAASFLPRVSAGEKALSAELDRLTITMVNGTDAFDAGAINIQYEG